MERAVTEGSSPADGNPYRPPVPGQPDPQAQPYGQPQPYPQARPYGQPEPYAQPQPYAQAQPYAQPHPPYTQPPYLEPSPLYGQPPYGQPRRANGTALAALITGVVAVVLGVIPFVCVVGVLAGLTAVVLGLAGLRRSDLLGGKGRAIGGIVTGVVAIAIGGAMTIVTLRIIDDVGDGWSQLAQQDNDERGEHVPDPEEPAENPTDKSDQPLDGIVAPAGSTASGGIPVGPSGIAGTTDGAASDAVVVTVYSDYLCPYCGEFESTNGATLGELRAQGDIVIEYHPVSILDRLAQGSAYSTRAAAAAALVADRAPEAFVGFDAALFAQQPAEGTTGWTDVEIAGIARGAGVPEEVVAVIESSEYLSGADSFVPWVTAATEQAAQDLGSLGTPTVLLDGAPLTVNWAIPGALAQAIDEARTV
jgi:protein-disulfide isomerase